MADVTIEYKGTNIATMDASGTKTLETSGKYCEGDVQVVYADPEKPMQSKSATPSLSAQTIFPDSGKVLSSVSVAAITKELLATLDSDFAAENIKKDVDLFGLLGTLEGGGGAAQFSTGHFTLAEDTGYYTVTHEVGAVPTFWILCSTDLTTNKAKGLCFSCGIQKEQYYSDNRYHKVGPSCLVPNFLYYVYRRYGTDSSSSTISHSSNTNAGYVDSGGANYNEEHIASGTQFTFGAGDSYKMKAGSYTWVLGVNDTVV